MNDLTSLVVTEWWHPGRQEDACMWDKDYRPVGKRPRSLQKPLCPNSGHSWDRVELMVQGEFAKVWRGAGNSRRKGKVEMRDGYHFLNLWKAPWKGAALELKSDREDRRKNKTKQQPIHLTWRGCREDSLLFP